ncbi:nucleotide synthetase [Novosphingobium sp. ZW T3_23]|uniref:nucleotide synthetase n=1 Tax=Novosphingobium sp. ZW T3_23 TaxID=3378084 RepID=UPI003854DFD6
MSTLNYTQYGLSPSFDLGLSDDAQVVQFRVTLAVEDCAIALRYEVVGEKDLHYIPITCDSKVEIELVGDQLYFSKEWDAITTKEALSSYYGGLEYSKYDKELDRYKVVRFQARFNRGGKLGTKHPFNINVDLLQGTRCAPQWIGLTIDPDIKNPPPQGGQ